MSSGPYSYETGIKKTFHEADYAVFGSSLAASAAIGVFYLIKDRNKQTTEEYLMAGRQLHPLPVAMSMLSSFISAITILGTPAEVYVYSTMYWWISVGMLVTAAGAAHIFIPVFYSLGVTSVFEYVERRFGYLTRVIACIIYIVWMMLYMSIILYVPSLALHAVTDLSLWGSVIAVGLVCIFYTTLGGMKAVVWADTLQMFIVFAGMLTILVVGAENIGGISNAWDIANKRGRIVIFEFNTDPRMRHSVWSMVFGGGIFWCAIFGTNQAQVQRAISVKSLSKAKMSMWLNWPGMAAIIIISCLVGVVMFAFYETCDPVKFGLITKPDQLILPPKIDKKITNNTREKLLPLYMMDLLGDIHGLPGLLLSCIFSGSLSSVSSGLNALAAVLLEDFVKPHCCTNLSSLKETWLSRGFVVLCGVLALALAFVVAQIGTMILQLAYVLFGVLGGPLLGLFTLGMLFPWANKWGSVCGLLSSLTLLLWIGLGASFTGTTVTIKPSVSVNGCNWNISGVASPTSGLSNVTTLAGEPNSIVDTSSGVERLYTVSYMWYSGIGVCTVVIVGLAVSWITGRTDPSTLDPKLICPFFDIFCPFLPEGVRKVLRFGVRHGEEVDDLDDDKRTVANGKVSTSVDKDGVSYSAQSKAYDNSAFDTSSRDTRL